MSDENWYPTAYLERLKCLKDRPYAMSADFVDLLQFMNARSLEEERELEVGLRANYDFWAAHFELLKREFNALDELFLSTADRLRGWFRVSPNEAQWGAVGMGPHGYTFASCIMKNHKPDAPLSEKSLSIGFTCNGVHRGIGDEGDIGRKGELDANLIGINACQENPAFSTKERYEATRRMCNGLADHRLVFRLNHHRIGQQVSEMAIDVLHRYTLVDLAERLFWALNQDMFVELKKELPETTQFLLE